MGEGSYFKGRLSQDVGGVLEGMHIIYYTLSRSRKKGNKWELGALGELIFT